MQTIKTSPTERKRRALVIPGEGGEFIVLKTAAMFNGRKSPADTLLMDAEQLSRAGYFAKVVTIVKATVIEDDR